MIPALVRWEQGLEFRVSLGDMARLRLQKKNGYGGEGWSRVFLIAIDNLLNACYVQIYKDYTMDLRTFIEC